MATEDQVLFGSSNAQIANEFCDRIEIALKEGVASLPLMADGKDEHTDNEEIGGEMRRDKKMLQKLRKSYIRNVDIVEIYAGRNIFSVSDRTPHFRQRVVEALAAQATSNSNEISAEAPQEGEGSTTNSGTTVDPSTEPVSGDDTAASVKPNSLLVDVTGKQDIPSRDMATALENDMQSLRIKLEHVRKLRAERSTYCTDLEQAAVFSETSQETLSEVSVDKLPQAVEAMVEAQDNFAVLKEQGGELIQNMDAQKKGRPVDENETDQLVVNAKMMEPSKKKKLTLEEHFHEHRSALAETQTRDILAVRELLQRKKV